MPFKTCNNCQAKNGVRTLVCKNCNQPYVGGSAKPPANPPTTQVKRRFGNKKRGLRVDDWRALNDGDRIRVISGSGPHYVLPDGRKQYTSDKGVYIVRRVDKLGLVCEGDGKLGGSYFIYMGPKKKSPLCHNLWREKHRIRKL